MSILRVLILLSILVPGCISHKQTEEFVNVGKQSVDNIPRAIIGAARAQLGANQAVLDAYERDITARIAAQDAAMNEIKNRIEEQEKAWKDFVLVVAQAAGSSIPGGGPIVGNFVRALGKTRDDAATYADKVKTETERKLVDKIAAMKSEMRAATEARLAQLDKETLLKFAGIEKEHLVELEKLKGDDKAFRAMLQQKAKLTEAEMEALKGFSTDELMAMLLAASGAAAAGGALGKTGRSRAQSQIDAIHARLGPSGNKTN